MDNIKQDSKTRLYKTWQNMRSRCSKTYDSKYAYYGGKGIKVCPEWDNNFKNFKEWALQNGYTDEMTIDRIDSKKDYCPDNCQWLTMEQNRRKMLQELGKDKMGRPTQEPKTNGYRIRLTDKELQKLEECCKITSMSKADIIRLGIDKVYEKLKNENS